MGDDEEFELFVDINYPNADKKADDYMIQYKNTQNMFKSNKIMKTSIDEWLSLWSIDINLAKIVSTISSNSIRNEMKIGNIPIGPLKNRKWERVHSIISS